jgi:beta-glucosidase
MGRVGDRVAATATVNEPWCVAWLSHFLGLHAPGLRDIRAAARAMHHVLLAHERAAQAMRAMGLSNLGRVPDLEWTEPADASPEAARAAATYHAIYNRWFVEAVFRRAYPAEALAGLGAHMPAGWEDDLDIIATPVDWLGVNYYTRHIVGPGDGPWPALADVAVPLPKTDMGWEIYPDGLYEILTWLATVTPQGLPIYVTENGMADARPTDDTVRIDYLDRHFAAARRAIADGVPLKGYFVWSLLDNYEWAMGYAKRFGLVHVDFDTLERRPKASLQALSRALTPQS